MPEALKQNVEIVETRNGKYRIIYENHSFPPGVDRLGNNYAGLVMEGVGSPEKGQTVVEWMRRQKTPEEEQKSRRYREQRAIMKQMEKEGRPMFNVDTHGGVTFGFSQLYGVPVAEWLIGSKVLGRQRRKVGADMTRRQFLKRAGLGLAELYLKGDAIMRAVASVAPFAGWFEPGKMSESLYPQSSNYVLTLRNLIAAEKMEKVYTENKNEFGGKELVAVYGAMHTGLADALKKGSEARLKEIRKIISLLVALPASIRPPTTIGLILRFDFSKERDAWHITQSFDDADISRIVQEVG
jgi:hypothetical protein